MNLNDGTGANRIEGGDMNGVTLALNWYLNNNMNIMFDWAYDHRYNSADRVVPGTHQRLWHQVAVPILIHLHFGGYSHVENDYLVTRTGGVDRPAVAGRRAGLQLRLQLRLRLRTWLPDVQQVLPAVRLQTCAGLPCLLHDEEKVTEYKYTCICEDVCIPGVTPCCCKRCESCGCCNECGCQNGNNGCEEGCCGKCRVREISKLVKIPVCKEVPVRKCTVEWVCPIAPATATAIASQTPHRWRLRRPLGQPQANWRLPRCREQTLNTCFRTTLTFYIEETFSASPYLWAALGITG